MIISGGSRSNGGFFAKHLTNDRDGSNDRVEVCELRGLAADTVDGGFREMAAVASGTRTKNYFYHANINPMAHEHLTPAQWGEAIDLLEKNLGLEGQPRMVFEHSKQGRTHRHVVWSRIAIDSMRAIGDSQTAKIHERTSRELEIKFDLVRGHSVLEPGREGPRERGPKSWENFRGLKSGIDPVEMKAELSELWRRSDSGKAFAAAIEDRGYRLARGDRRDFVVVDHAGDAHSLARRLQGVKAADVRVHMVDIDRDALPGVIEARTAQQALFTRDGTFDRAAAVSAWENRGYAGVRGDAGERGADAPLPDATPQVELDGDRQDAGKQTGRDDPALPGDAAARPAENVAGRGGIKVMDGAIELGARLADIVADILSLGATESKAERPKVNPYLVQLQALDRAAQALAHIRESIERGEGVQLQDLKNLTPQHLASLAARGDDGLRAMIRRDDGDRLRYQGYERER